MPFPWDAEPSRWFCHPGTPARPCVAGHLHWVSSVTEGALIRPHRNVDLSIQYPAVPSSPHCSCQHRQMHRGMSHSPRIIPHTVASNKRTSFLSKRRKKISSLPQLHWFDPGYPTAGLMEQWTSPLKTRLHGQPPYLVGDSLLQVWFLRKLTDKVISMWGALDSMPVEEMKENRINRDKRWAAMQAQQKPQPTLWGLLKMRLSRVEERGVGL